MCYLNFITRSYCKFCVFSYDISCLIDFFVNLIFRYYILFEIFVPFKFLYKSLLSTQFPLLPFKFIPFMSLMIYSLNTLHDFFKYHLLNIKTYKSNIFFPTFNYSILSLSSPNRALLFDFSLFKLFNFSFQYVIVCTSTYIGNGIIEGRFVYCLS